MKKDSYFYENMLRESMHDFTLDYNVIIYPKENVNGTTRIFNFNELNELIDWLYSHNLHKYDMEYDSIIDTNTYLRYYLSNDYDYILLSFPNLELYELEDDLMLKVVNGTLKLFFNNVCMQYVKGQKFKLVEENDDYYILDDMHKYDNLVEVKREDLITFFKKLYI